MSEKDTSISLQMKPFSVPNFALVELPPQPKQAGVQALPPFHVRELPIKTLDGLADQWRRDLYKNAGKPLPEDRP